MRSERKRILDLLSEGKITAEEADQLLDAIGQQDTESSQEQETYSRSISHSIGNTIKRAINSAIETANNALDDIDVVRININGFESGPTEKKTYRFDEFETLRHIAADTAFGDLQIRPAREDALTVTLSYPESWTDDQLNANTSVSMDAGTLSVHCHPDGERRGIITKKAQISCAIDLPEHALSSIELRSSCGDLKVDGITAETVTLKSSNGDLSVKNAALGDVEMTSSNGDLRLKHTTFTGDAKMRSSNGDCILEDTKGGSIDVKTSRGDVKCVDSSVQNARAISSCGDIKLRRIAEGATDIHCSTSMGDVKIDLSEYTSPVQIDAEFPSMIGNCSVDSRFAVLEKGKGYLRAKTSGTLEATLKIYAKTTMGSIHIR